MTTRRHTILTSVTLLVALVCGVAADRRLIDEREMETSPRIPLLSESETIAQTCSQTCNGDIFNNGTCTGNMTLNCDKTLTPESGVRMEAIVELFCFGSFVNISAPSADGIQTRVSCMGDLKMTAFVSTLLPKRRVRSKFIFKYRCGNSFSSVTNQDLEMDGSIGTNFYQNAICNGTEQTMMKYSAHGDLLSELIGTGGSFLVVHMGTCSEAATLLSSIDILGVFYSYVVIPGCEPEASPDRSKLYTQKEVPISMSCNGEKQNITKACKGLLIGVTPIKEGTVSCKCRGNWAPSGERFNCTGELYGEQERHGAMGSYTRSSVCAGKNTFEPIFVKDYKGRPLSGSNVTCYGAAVKSTIFGPSPYQRSAPFQRRL